MMDTLTYLAPFATLLVGGLVIMMIDAFASERSELATITSLVLIGAGGFSLGLTLSDTTGAPPELIASYLATDKFSLLMDMIICGGTALAVMLAGGYLAEHELERGEFYVLMLFSAFGAMVLGRANDLLTLFIGLETMSLGAYCLIGFRRRSSRSAEAAIKYFLLGSFAAAILLLGSALIYAGTGHTNLAQIGEAISSGSANTKLVMLALFFLLVGLAFKVSAVPFHMWTPDAYEGAPTPATTFMAVAVKSAAFAVVLRVMVVCFSDELMTSGSTGWPPFLAALAALTMVFGNIAAIGQSSVKRMLAYSSIAHAGYILVGVVATFRGGEIAEQATAGVLYYLMAYTVSNVLGFGALIWVGSKGREAVSYEDLAGVGRRHPIVAVPFILGVFSLMGLPPTAGFFGKYYVFSAAISAGGGMVWLSLLGVLASAVGAYYYLKVLVYMFMKDPQPGAPIAIPMKSGYVVFALILSGYFVIKMGITPQPYLELAVDAAKSLTGN